MAVLGAVQSVRLPDPLLTRLCEEVDAVQSGQAVQGQVTQAAIQAATAQPLQGTVSEASPLQAAPAAPSPVWLLPAMAHITTLVLHVTFESDRGCLSRLAAVQAAGYLKAVTHVVLYYYDMYRAPDVARALAACPQLTVSTAQPLPVSEIEFARDRHWVSELSAQEQQVLKEMFLC